MPSFVCDTCQETLKKQKLDLHHYRCKEASYSCIDCGVSFPNQTYQSHTSCITEAEKYQKSLYKKKKCHQSATKISTLISEDTTSLRKVDKTLTTEAAKQHKKVLLIKALKEMKTEMKQNDSISLRKLEAAVLQKMQCSSEGVDSHQLGLWIRKHLKVTKKDQYLTIKI
jgi:cell growth-regulating nucleolar protein